MECYSQQDLTGNEKVIEICKGDFYMIYPVKKQLVVAFGEGDKNRLGVGSTSNTGPKPAFITKNMGPKRIFSSFSHSCLIDKKDQLWRCGVIKRSSNEESEYTFVNIKEKVRLVALGKFSIFVVTDDNKIYRQGFSKEGALGINSDYSNMTKMEKVDDEE